MRLLVLSEKEGEAIRNERSMDAFRHAIDLCALRDLGFMADEEWFALFRHYEETYDKLFKFEALWLSREDCWKIVDETWMETTGMQAHKKIANCKKIQDVENELKKIQNRRTDHEMINVRLSQMNLMNFIGYKNLTSMRELRPMSLRMVTKHELLPS
ncbi:Mycothiol acetyltransferase [Bienertia sinuspersici]